jgi:hypothetical protein
MYSPEKLEAMERELEERLLERYREGIISEALSEYFESGEDYDHVSLRSDSELQEILHGNVGGVARREGPDVPVRNLPESSYSPHTNRGVTFNHSPLSSSPGGYDGGIELGFSGTWDFPQFRELKTKLETYKEQSLSKDTMHTKESVTFELGGKTFVMCPKSVVMGAAYRYVIEGMGIRIYIHTNPKGDIQPIRVHYLAIGLIGRDFFQKHSEVRDFIETLGFEIHNEKLSRVDMQVLTETPIQTFVSAYMDDKVVCPAQTLDLRGRVGKYETLTLGGDLQVCIYDKRRELEKQLKSDPLKVALMLGNVLGTDFFEKTSPLTRIEFRFRRAVLKDFGINSVQDLLEKETSLALYCCRKWFRILKDPKKEGHSSRQETAPYWKEIQGFFLLAFPGVEGHREEAVRTCKTEIRTTAPLLHAQAGGCKASAAVLELGAGADFVTFLRYLLEKTGQYAGKIYERYLERAAEFSARVFGAASEVYGCCTSSLEVVREEIENWFSKYKRDVQLNLSLDTEI